MLSPVFFIFFCNRKAKKRSQRLRIDIFGETHPIKPLCMVIVIGVFTFFAIIFVPQKTIEPPQAAIVEQKLLAPKRDNAGTRIQISFFASLEAQTYTDTLLLHSPPILVPKDTQKAYCEEWATQGTIVLSISWLPVFQPVSWLPPLPTVKALGRIKDAVLAYLFQGRAEFGEAAAHRLEKARTEDIWDVLAWLGQTEIPALASSRQKLVLSSSGFGSTAMNTCASILGHERAIATISIEGRIQGEAIYSEQTKDKNKISSFFIDLYKGLGLRRPSGYQSLPSITHPSIYFTAQTIQITQTRDTRYAGLIRTLYSSSAPALLIAFEKASSLSYSSVAQRYPLYAFIHPTTRQSWQKTPDFQVNTAKIAIHCIQSLRNKAPLTTALSAKVDSNIRFYTEHNGKAQEGER
jgi:hypothetical protein